MIEWRPVRGNARAIVSACGNYSVAKVTVGGIDHFEAWALNQKAGAAKFLGKAAPEEEPNAGGGAKRLAELHASTR